MVAFAADQLGDHRRFLIGLAWTGLAVLLVLAQFSTFWPLLIGSVLFSLAVSTIMPLTETMAMTGVKAAGLDYGRMRLWGSLSFIVASICGGWGDRTVGCRRRHLADGRRRRADHRCRARLQRPTGLGRLKAATSPPRLRVADALGLLRSRVFLIFLLATGLVQGSHACSTPSVCCTGASKVWTPPGRGRCGAWRSFARSRCCLFGGRVAASEAGLQLIVLGCAAAVVRWLVMGFDPPLALLVLLQVSHSLTYTASHIGAIHFISGMVADRQSGTAQALYASVTGGIGLGAAMLIAGPLYASYGGRGYWAMAVMAAMALGCRSRLGSAVLTPTAPCLAAVRRARHRSAGPPSRSRASRSGPSRSTQSASCASK